MKNNILTFGDTYWHQISGAAMGSPPSPPWATLFFALKEDEMKDQYQHVLIYYKRFINDVLGIWLWQPNNDSLWTDFQTDFNNYHGLLWTFSNRSMTVNFMDLTLSTREGKVYTWKIYLNQQDINDSPSTRH